MMLAGSLAAAMAEASAWRNRCGCASTPTSRAKVRNAWVACSGRTGVSRIGAQDQVQLDRPRRLPWLDQQQLH